MRLPLSGGPFLSRLLSPAALSSAQPGQSLPRLQKGQVPSWDNTLCLASVPPAQRMPGVRVPSIPASGRLP